MVDISDYFSVVCVTNIPVKKHNPIKCYRDYSNFDQESYAILMQSTGMLSIVMICIRQLLK